MRCWLPRLVLPCRESTRGNLHIHVEYYHSGSLTPPAEDWQTSDVRQVVLLICGSCAVRHCFRDVFRRSPTALGYENGHPLSLPCTAGPCHVYHVLHHACHWWPSGPPTVLLAVEVLFDCLAFCSQCLDRNWDVEGLDRHDLEVIGVTNGCLGDHGHLDLHCNARGLVGVLPDVVNVASA